MQASWGLVRKILRSAVRKGITVAVRKGVRVAVRSITEAEGSGWQSRERGGQLRRYSKTADRVAAKGFALTHIGC